jgi:hypothetical protein
MLAKKRIIYLIGLLCLFSMLISSCKKTPFYGHGCSENCYILSGFIYDDSTGQPMNNVEVVFNAKHKYFHKDIVETSSDESGFWEMSFNADYIENLNEGKLIYSSNSYLTREQTITFDTSEIDIEKGYETSMYKSAKIYLKINLTNDDVKRIHASYTFNENLYKVNTLITEDKPILVNMLINIPAYTNIDLSLNYSTSTNIDNPSSGIISNNTYTFYLGYKESETLEINF